MEKHDDSGIEACPVAVTHEVSQYERVFNSFDENGEGKISPAELRQCVEAMGVNLSAKDEVNDLKEAFEMYDKMDSDFVFKIFGRRAVGRRIMRNYKSTRNRKANRGTNLLPVSQNDLKNALHQKPLLCFAFGIVLDISPQQHGILLMLFGSILSYLAKNSTSTPFEFRDGKTRVTPQSLISLDEAFYAFIPEMAHITMFIICYIMTWMLVLPLRPGVQMFLVLLLISAPLFYFPELVRKASTSGVIVTCSGSFKLPLIGFTTLAAFGITLIFGLMAMLVVYLNKRFIHGTPTRGQDIEVTDGLLSVF